MNKSAFVIVEYKSAYRTIEYVKHLSKKVIGEFEIIIVDNSMNDTNSRLIIDEFHMSQLAIDCLEKVFIGKNAIVNVYLIIATSNGGFAKGNNLGVQIANYILEDIKYIIFSNNDLQILDEYFLLNDFLKDFLNPEIGIIGPSIVGEDGKRQSPYCQLSFANRWILYPILYPLNKLIHKLQLDNDLLDVNTKQKVFRVMGAFFAVNLEYFNQVGGFDEGTFLYGEELIISAKFLQHRYVTLYNPNFHILHKHDMTIGKFYNIQQKYMLLYESELYYYQKYLKISFWQVFLSKMSVKFLLLKMKIIHDKFRRR